MEAEYHGFEQGPIRPPSEAASLFIRVTRNCPWNRCLFCPVYKGAQFSVRPVAHVLRDIGLVADYIGRLRNDGGLLQEMVRSVPPEERTALDAAWHWLAAGHMRSVFLQDADALFMRTNDLVEILRRLRQCFPDIRRVTSYARAHTVANKTSDDLRALAEAGLNRVHIGLESGCDEVLRFMKKGVTQARHVEAGRRVKAAGMELSEYFMPGLGGRRWTEPHARESAAALNQICPDFIRLRTLAIPAHTPLYQEYAAGRFEKCTEVETVREIRVFIEHLEGFDGAIKSDHILNLLGELEGSLPGDKPHLLALIDRFLALEPEEQALFQMGRRTGVFHRLADLEDPQRRAIASGTCRRYGITPENVDQVVEELIRRFI